MVDKALLIEKSDGDIQRERARLSGTRPNASKWQVGRNLNTGGVLRPELAVGGGGCWSSPTPALAFRRVCLCSAAGVAAASRDWWTVGLRRPSSCAFPGAAKPIVDVFCANQDVKCLSAISETSWLWHRRLGHMHMEHLKDISSKELVRGLLKIKFEKDKVCDAC
ncbi:hypothetical protein RJ640_001527 [Escallonia rubra]|uniref:GAG-pre-integrase domain-containing protein n=1 Tax=Escallonia rubra TaxID=112253 RepID=A0AA88RRQ9_9ASTE|nr:hypothetical protein RJ640_001527 [Escallonia rubra]